MREVREFHTAFGLPQADTPTIPGSDTVSMRRTLIQEECAEVTEALDKVWAATVYPGPTSEDAPLLAHLAKELADLRYVVEGCALTFGIDLDAVYDIVHASNMSKLGADGKPIYREDGKVLKGPMYAPAEPAIARLLTES